MKKLIALLLVLVIVVGCFAACSGNKTDATTAPNGTTAPEATTQPVETTQPDAYETITIAQALELCGESGNITEERYYIRATVESIKNPTYGQMTITDETGSIDVYGTYSEDGAIPYGQMEKKPYKGDEVLLYCILQNYNGTKEVKNAWLIEFTHVDTPVDDKDYTAMSIADARAAEKGAKVKVSGVVARITYANGMIPSGVYLVDNTNCIYVYDGDLAARVAIGNTITVLGSKTWWILGSEESNAAKFGYKGCCQLESATLVSNDEKTSDFDTSWITESTVKEILDTPVTEDITTTIYKVTAKVVKTPGNGFTNYYFYDLDGVTGSYAYTQCNGSDFAWLDEFDGKICTVYLSAINAKSTAADCYFRLLPVKVIDEGFSADSINVPEYAVKYHGVTQFAESYTGNPALELLTEVSSTELNFQGAKLSYASDNTAVITIDTVNGKVIMNCKTSGTANITVTGEYNGKTYSEKVAVSVTITEMSGDYANVQGAIDTAVGETVTVKGIVGPSLVNRSGFYLIDESGVIAVITDADTLATLKIGNEVILEGVRHINTKGGSGYYGQTCLNDAKLVANNYGEHAYSTAAFKGDITVADFYNLDVATDYTTNVYTMKATVYLEEQAYFSNIYLMDGNTKVRLYSSSASQYSWLQAFAGQEVTVEIAPCNWNDKNYYTGCVLSVITDSGKVVNQLNFGK